jgi:hypothetical protein
MISAKPKPHRRVDLVLVIEDENAGWHQINRISSHGA